MARIRIDLVERNRRIAGSRGLVRAVGIKHASLSRDLDRIYRSAARLLQKAILNDDSLRVEFILSRLQTQAADVYHAALAFAVEAAYEYLDSEEGYEDYGREDDRTGLGFWLPALYLYVDNLRREINWFLGQDFPKGELLPFLGDPLSYLAERKVPTESFRKAVNVGQGRRYQVRKDFSKNLLYAMTSAMYDTLRRKYQERGVVAYVGFRNGDYPCDICDEYEGRVMPIEDMVYPLHVNCICGWYELYSDEVSAL